MRPSRKAGVEIVLANVQQWCCNHVHNRSYDGHTCCSVGCCSCHLANLVHDEMIRTQLEAALAYSSVEERISQQVPLPLAGGNLSGSFGFRISRAMRKGSTVAA
jgi:hypothetical protein